MKRILSIAKDVMSIPTAPFREQLVREHIVAFCKARGVRVRQDDMGNLVATYGAGFKGPVFAFAAHMDHPGFMAVSDSRGGRLRALFYGMVEEEYFKGTDVRFFTSAGEVSGNVVSTDFSRSRYLQKVTLSVEGKVKKGDLGMWDLKAFSLRGDRIYCRACDDLVGCASVLALFDELKRRGIQRKVMGVFSVAEEGGLNGATYMAMKTFIPRGASMVAIETSMELPQARMGDGVVIRVGDRVSIFDPDMTRLLERVAKDTKSTKKDFKYQRKLMDGGVCESSVYQAFGYRTGSICIPLGNYHNRYFAGKKIRSEYVSSSDLINMVELFIALVKNAKKADSFLKKKPPRVLAERRALGERFYLAPDVWS